MNEIIGIMGLVLFVFFFMVAWSQKKGGKNDGTYSKEWEEKMDDWEDDYF